jgi:hypothetical protein
LTSCALATPFWTTTQSTTCSKASLLDAAFLSHISFSDGLQEMDDARAVVGDLIEEYAAAGKSDFLEWCARRDEADKAKAK